MSGDDKKEEPEKLTQKAIDVISDAISLLISADGKVVSNEIKEAKQQFETVFGKDKRISNKNIELKAKEYLKSDIKNLLLSEVREGKQHADELKKVSKDPDSLKYNRFMHHYLQTPIDNELIKEKIINLKNLKLKHKTNQKIVSLLIYIAIADNNYDEMEFRLIANIANNLYVELVHDPQKNLEELEKEKEVGLFGLDISNAKGRIVSQAIKNGDLTKEEGEKYQKFLLSKLQLSMSQQKKDPSIDMMTNIMETTLANNSPKEYISYLKRTLNDESTVSSSTQRYSSSNDDTVGLIVVGVIIIALLYWLGS